MPTLHLLRSKFLLLFFLPKSQVLCNSVSTTRKIRLMLKAFDSLLAYCYHCHNCHWYRYQTLRRQGGMEKTAELYSSCRLTFSRGDREGDYTSQSTFSMDRHERKSWHSPLHHSLVKQQKTPTAGWRVHSSWESGWISLNVYKEFGQSILLWHQSNLNRLIKRVQKKVTLRGIQKGWFFFFQQEKVSRLGTADTE